jgi:hypothetical protein
MELDFDPLDEWDYAFCEHGIYKGLVGGVCDACDDYEEKRGGIDKCMNCGGYKWGDQLNEFQVCKRPCQNPNEY